MSLAFDHREQNSHLVVRRHVEEEHRTHSADGLERSRRSAHDESGGGADKSGSHTR